MTDHAAVVREGLLLLNGAVTCGEPHSPSSTAAASAALAALDALVAERDAWKVEAVHHSGEAIRLREALEKIYSSGRGLHVEIARDALNEDM